MDLLIIALVVILLLLSWKYILRLEPAGVFALIWGSSIPVVLLLQYYISLQLTGILFIVGGIFFFMFGTIFCDTIYQPKSSKKELEFRKDWAFPIMLILVIGAMVNPLYSIILHGFSLEALLSMQDLLNMNRQISEDRYMNGGVTNAVNQLAPLFGGFCYRWVGKWTRIVCILTLIPGIFIAMTQSMKMGMITGFVLWFAGYLVCSFSYGITVQIKLKYILYTGVGIIVFFAILFSSMVFRTGEISERTITDISQKFITYALGHFHCFEMWFTTYETTVYSYGTKTFLGISNVVGLEDKIQGIYQEYHQIGQNGYYGISNIFTIFRSLIEDFGESGTYLVMFVLGFLSKYSLKNLTSRRNIFANQVFITAAYAYLLWSFATSFFAYTSYIATFFVAYFLFMVHDERCGMDLYHPDDHHALFIHHYEVA